MATVGTTHKSRLIDRIKSIQNSDILDEVSRLLDVDIEETTYQTSADQKKEIEIAQSQISKGQGISSEEADSEIEGWLSK
ncbi:MAG: hypothetical protein AAF363_18190 [Bacteroidota bacterium]